MTHYEEDKGCKTPLVVGVRTGEISGCCACSRRMGVVRLINLDAEEVDVRLGDQIEFRQLLAHLREGGPREKPAEFFLQHRVRGAVN